MVILSLRALEDVGCFRLALDDRFSIRRLVLIGPETVTVSDLGSVLEMPKLTLTNVLHNPPRTGIHQTQTSEQHRSENHFHINELLSYLYMQMVLVFHL